MAHKSAWNEAFTGCGRFRTHSLVCVASALLMLVTVIECGMTQVAVDAMRTDPTHMAQGIMTGIGSAAQE
jgi:uncharacterized membrane protein YhiD involved in acid resistance